MLAPLLGVKETVPVVATALIISNIARIWAFRKSVAFKEYLAVFLTGLPFIVLSAYVYVSLPVGVVALVLGLFLLVSIPLNRSLKKKEVKVGLRGLALLGSLWNCFGQHVWSGCDVGAFSYRCRSGG